MVPPCHGTVPGRRSRSNSSASSPKPMGIMAEAAQHPLRSPDAFFFSPEILNSWPENHDIYYDHCNFLGGRKKKKKKDKESTALANPKQPIGFPPPGLPGMPPMPPGMPGHVPPERMCYGVCDFSITDETSGSSDSSYADVDRSSWVLQSIFLL